MNSIQDIKHTVYINLDTRPDRKAHVEEQFKSLGINCERFNAIKLPNGALGCSMSHLKCIEIAKENKWPHIFLVEDDILFTNIELFKEQLNSFLSKHKDFDVLLVAGNNVPPYYPVDDSCVKVSKCQTTTGYIVQSHYYDTLIDNYREGINNLFKHPTQHRFFAIDKYWFKLQEKDNWYLIVPLTVIQREDYSDIEKKQTNYGRLMLDLDKKEFFKNQIQSQLKEQARPKLNLFNL